MLRHKPYTITASGLAAAISIAAAGCSTGAPPVAESTSSVAPALPPTSSPAPIQPVHVDTLNIGDTGTRCFVGIASFSCAASSRQMTLGSTRAWTLVGAAGPPGGLEPGFAPGELTAQPAVGDIVLIVTSSCRSAGTQPGSVAEPMMCKTAGLTATVHDFDNDILVGVVTKADAGQLTIRTTDFEFSLQLPQAQNRVFYRPNPGQQLNQDQPIKIRQWTFGLHGSTLTITGPHGPTDVGV